MKRGGEKKEIIFPLLKVLMRMKSILSPDLDSLKFRQTREGAEFLGRGIILYKKVWKSRQSRSDPGANFSPGSSGASRIVCLALEHKDISKHGSSVRKSLEWVTPGISRSGIKFHVLCGLCGLVFLQESG